MSDLPEGWTSASINCLCEKVRGVSYSKSDVTFSPIKGFVPILRANNITDKGITNEDLVYVPPKYVKEHQYIRQNDIVVAMSSGSISVVGKAAQIKNMWDGSFGAFCGVFRPIKNINPALVGYFFSSSDYRNGISDLAKGTNINNVKAEHFDEIEIPLPPLPEQNRIVAKLDQIIPRIDACKERLDKIPLLLKRFRQSILESAYCGNMTLSTRNLEINAEELKSQLLQDHLDIGGHKRGNASIPSDDVHDLVEEDLPENWSIIELKDLCKPGKPITYGILKPGPDTKNGILYIRVADYPGNKLNLDNIKRTTKQIDQMFQRSKLIQGDLLISIRGSVGRLIKIPKECNGANITQDSARLSISSRVNSNFIYYMLLSKTIQDRLQKAIKGVAIRGINIGDLRAVQIPLPPLEEQAEIVRRVEALFAVANRIEEHYKVAKVAVNKLTPSTLAKAFRGELVPQDPKDEPASVLLERIKASSSADVKQTKRVKRG